MNGSHVYSRRCLILTGMTGIDTARSMSGEQGSSREHVNPPPSWCATVVWNSAQVGLVCG